MSVSLCVKSFIRSAFPLPPVVHSFIPRTCHLLCAELCAGTCQQVGPGPALSEGRKAAIKHLPWEVPPVLPPTSFVESVPRVSRATARLQPPSPLPGHRPPSQPASRTHTPPTKFNPCLFENTSPSEHSSVAKKTSSMGQQRLQGLASPCQARPASSSSPLLLPLPSHLYLAPSCPALHSRQAASSGFAPVATVSPGPGLCQLTESPQRPPSRGRKEREQRDLASDG